MKILLKKYQVARVFGSMRWLFHSPKQTRRRERNWHAVNFVHNNVFRGLGIFDSTCRLHQIYNDFITNADDAVLCDFAGSKFPHCFIRKNSECFVKTLFVFWLRIDKQVNIHGASDVACGPHCKASNHHVAGAFSIELAAKLN